MARRAGAGPAGHRRSVAPRSVRSPVVLPFATSWTTTHRFAVSRSNWAPGGRESAVGRAANSRRTAQARSRRLRTHGVALPARTAEETVTDLAHIYCESPRPVRMQYASAVTVRVGRRPPRRVSSTCHSISCGQAACGEAMRAVRWACLGQTPRSWLTLHSGAPSRTHGHAR